MRARPWRRSVENNAAMQLGPGDVSSVNFLEGWHAAMQLRPLDTPSSSGDADDPTFHEILRSHRNLAGLTQQALADLSTISPRTIRDLEAGRANARKQTIHLLADALRLHGVVRETFVHAGLGNQSM